MIYSCGIIVNMGLILIETKILMSINSSISSQSQTTIPAAALVATPAECQLKNGLSIQTKLSIDAIDDPLEHEADAVADQVMRMPEINFIQRKCDHCEEEEQVQRKPLAAFITPIIQTKSNGKGYTSGSLNNRINNSLGSCNDMYGQSKSFMANRFDAGFSGIKMHANGNAVQLSPELNAKAFTSDRDMTSEKIEKPVKRFDPGVVHDACSKANDMNDKEWRSASRIPFDPAKEDMAPDDPISIYENSKIVNGVVDSFKDWDNYRFGLIIVPGYTPPGDATKRPIRMHPTEKDRLIKAKEFFDKKDIAPFIYVSGGAVYPEGTPCFEGVEMKHELLHMGMPEERIIVDAAAQHSTTNIRNAGRYMFKHNILKRAFIVTSYLQDFYFSHPDRSSFHKRSENELGYQVGNLRNEKGWGTSSYEPSPEVENPGKDKMDR